LPRGLSLPRTLAGDGNALGNPRYLPARSFVRVVTFEMLSPSLELRELPL
jgi:hypothetical protein